MIANPHVVSECKIAQLALFECSADSQAGVVTMKLFGYGGFCRSTEHSLQKPGGGVRLHPAASGCKSPQYLVVHARTGSDYGLDVTATGISHLLPLAYIAPIFWGVPGDHFYDLLQVHAAEAKRKAFFSAKPIPFQALAEHDAATARDCSVPYGLAGRDVPSSLPIAPMIQNPTTCVGPLESHDRRPLLRPRADHAADPWPATTGCDALSFDPSLAANPTTTNTDTASGLDVVLNVAAVPGSDHPVAVGAQGEH